MLFSLKFQRDNRQNALAVDPAKGKTGEKRLYFHRTIEMKQLHTMTEPFILALPYGRICLSHPHSMMENTTFFSNVSVGGPNGEKRFPRCLF